MSVTSLFVASAACVIPFSRCAVRGFGTDHQRRKLAGNVGVSHLKTVFVDERAKLIDDPDHSKGEDRFVLLGLSSALRLLLVCHCYRSESNVIRIISARKATAKESKSYP